MVKAKDSSTSTTPNKSKVYETPQDANSLHAIVAVTLWLGWNGFLAYIIPYAVLFASNVQRSIILVVFTSSLLLPVDFPSALSPKIAQWIMLGAQKYFGLKLTIEDYEALTKVDKDGTAIFACEPHDVLPYSTFCFSPFFGYLPGRLNSTANVLMTGAVFRIPILKQVYSWVGGQPVDKATFRKRLSQNKMVSFVPGGVQEVLFVDPEKPNDIVLFLQSRKGFIKLALEKGVPIIPVFMFGLMGGYRGILFPKSQWATKLGRKIGFMPVIYFGRWWIPLGIPFPTKMHVVVGKPIDIPCLVGKGDNNNITNIPKEEVDKYHKLYIEKTIELFERHKVTEQNYGHRTLKII